MRSHKKPKKTDLLGRQLGLRTKEAEVVTQKSFSLVTMIGIDTRLLSLHIRLRSLIHREDILKRDSATVPASDHGRTP